MADELRLTVPTYHGHDPNWQSADPVTDDWGQPNVPLSVFDSGDGVRVVLGSHDYDARNVPEILIERRPNGWYVFLHPSDGDPVGGVAFRDDGQTFLQRDSYANEATIQVLEPGADVPDLDKAGN